MSFKYLVYFDFVLIIFINCERSNGALVQANLEAAVLPGMWIL